MTTEVGSVKSVLAENIMIRVPVPDTASVRLGADQVKPVTQTITVQIHVSVSALVNGDASQMVVAVEARETATRPLMTRVMKAGEVTVMEEAVVASREDAEEAMMGLRETVVTQEAGRRTRGTSS